MLKGILPRQRGRSAGRLLAVLAAVVACLPQVVQLSAQETGELAALRERALRLVNEDRRDRNLPPLTIGADLNEAALAHARDMLQRRYYAHASPDGNTVQDRYIEAGGDRWELVAENIARCEACRSRPDSETVDRLHDGWMNSPEHRANILKQGLARFGFAVLADPERGLYAAQTFAGPGTARGSHPGEPEKSVSTDRETALAAEAINEARRKAGVAPLEPDDSLIMVARNLLPPDMPAIEEIENGVAGLPAAESARWQSVVTIAGVCGGCGTTATRGDILSFVEDWLSHPRHMTSLLDEDASHLGFVLRASGRGKKMALAVIATAG